jgi:spore maturation protein CgeB
MLNILYLVRRNTSCCNYYNDMINYLKKTNNIDLKIYKKYISLLIENKKYDKIIIGFDITDCGYDYPPEIINDTNIPLYIILNKEYAALDKKLEWIKKLNPSQCFSVHHDVDVFEKKTGVPFFRISWSANEELFKDYQEEYKNDIFFSGVIRKEQTNNLRYKIYENLNKLNNLRVNFNANILGVKNMMNKYNNIEYAKELAKTKIGLITTGPANLVGTRYFEIMAGNRCLILCNRMNNKIYNDIVIDGFNCIMFDDENDFIEKCKYYINHEQERMKIVNQAYKYFLEKHTWNHKVKELIKYL